MKAILKDLYCIDNTQRLEEYSPPKIDNFGFWIRLIVGEMTMGGEESFDVMICTPQWLSANYKKTDIIIGRHFLIVFEYNYQRIYNKLKELIESLEAENWDDIGMLIGRIGKWEFEDYRA